MLRNMNNSDDNDSNILRTWCKDIDDDYDIAPAVIYSVLCAIGFIYNFFGYRLYRISLASTGFLFVTLTVYIICHQHAAIHIPLGAYIAIAIAIGIIGAIVAVCLEPVGHFIVGSLTGISIAIVIFTVVEQFYHLPSLWIPMGVLLSLWITFGVLTIRVQKTLFIVGTSVFGSALMLSCLDYFVERSYFVLFVYDAIRANVTLPVDCWYSWVLFACWPFVFVIGIVIQLRVTGHNYDHIAEVQELRRRKVQKLNLQKMRNDAQRDSKQSHYRHLYQVRRTHGDVISQTFLKDMQDHNEKMKSTPPPSTPSTLVPAGQTVISADSTQTTLSHLP